MSPAAEFERRSEGKDILKKCCYDIFAAVFPHCFSPAVTVVYCCVRAHKPLIGVKLNSYTGRKPLIQCHNVQVKMMCHVYSRSYTFW